ncbi:hypothetical protein ACHAXA_011113 [Cyclostephanos tholiformis]|uniref:Sister chromatid cohesion protein n=1 Tax=Cyclostephanos tholiformis TaxID=382380 RepID=A0ABD3SF87_9STRA
MESSSNLRKTTVKRSTPDVLSAAYLEGTSNKNELLRRLVTVTESLTALGDEDDDEIDDPSPPRDHHHRHSHLQHHHHHHPGIEHHRHRPGLPSLCASIASHRLLNHRDPDVRLHVVLAACELFYAYAPQPPWTGRDVLGVFGAVIRQITTLGESSPECQGEDFGGRFHIIEQLSELKIGAVLVDLINTEGGCCGGDRRGRGKGKGKKSSDEGGDDDVSDDDDADVGIANDALEVLCGLVRALLNCVRPDHPPEVLAHASSAVAACLEEFVGGIPHQVLEELLLCVGRGPVVWVTNPAFAGTAPGRAADASTGTTVALPPPPARIQQTNASYMVAARVLRRAEDKISSPIAALLNGLLEGDAGIVGRTSLSTVDAEARRAFFGKGRKRRRRVGVDEQDDRDEVDVGDDDDAEGSSPARTLRDRDLDDDDDDDDDDVSGTNVYSVSYELHKIAPQILTTVIGTVSTSLLDADVAKRWQAARLLGRLFGARTSDIASRFGPCFREWLRRSYDPEPKIRETMVNSLVNFLTTQHAQVDLCADVNEALAAIILRDPTLDIRLLGVHEVCNLALNAVVADPGAVGVGAGMSNRGSKRPSPHPLSVISSELLLAIGNRVSSKNKKEHKDAITGLAQIYHTHYLRRKLKYVQEGGDDVSIDEILQVWRELKPEEEEKFAWIPQRVFECVSYPDNSDPEMRNRVFHIVDDVLLGTTKKDSAIGGSALSPTSRAVGLALIMESVKEKENAFKWMCALFLQRSRLQKALGDYLDARSKARECETGSPEAFEADREAVEKLEIVASYSAPLGETCNKDDLESILKKVHGAKDKHIFRILSTISSPTHSPSSRLRAFDELPKRTKGLGSVAQSWVKILARRCAMGAFLNSEMVEHCIILSQESFEAENCKASALFLNCIKMATSIFPSLGSTKKGFQNLVEFFDASRTTSYSASMKRDMAKYGVVTTLSEILARCGTAPRPLSAVTKTGGVDGGHYFDSEDNNSSYNTLREQLVRLCTHDGTPEQARNSVYTISSMIKPQSESGGSIASRASREKIEFEPLLKALVNPCRLMIPEDNTNHKARERVVSILSAIAAIAECAPYAFNECGEGHKLGWGKRALAFALDRVLLGKSARLNASVDEEENSDSDSDEESSPGHRSSTNLKGREPQSKKAKVVSVHCQMLCSAMEVLVSHIRSTVVNSRYNLSESGAPTLKAPSPDHITEVFTTLTKFIEDGIPSSAKGRYCKTAKDQAELRRSAAVNLLRLCDANLQLETKYLTPRMWHILSSALVDEDKSISSSVMDELLAMYTGNGKFRANYSAPMAPSLRFVSLVTLCADGDGHGGQHSVVGKKVKIAATALIKHLRATSQVVQAQCRQQGRTAEKNFENRLKLFLMPEYSVPYALHLLAFRQETAIAAGTLAGENMYDSDVRDRAMAGEENKMIHAQEASQKLLKQRLKWLFDPLIQSLGAGADNVRSVFRSMAIFNVFIFFDVLNPQFVLSFQISFLMRMIDLIGKHPPINVLKTSTGGVSTLEMTLNEDDDDPDRYDMEEKDSMMRMKIICQFARELLLSHVKKDVNLTVYPGSIQFPGDLYSRRRPSSTSPINAHAYDSDEFSHKKARKPKKSISHYVKKSQDEMPLSDSDQSDVEDKLDIEEMNRGKMKYSLDDKYDYCQSFSPANQELETSSRNKPQKAKFRHHDKKSHNEMPSSKNDPSNDAYKLEDEKKTPEQHEDSPSDNPYEHSQSFSTSVSTPHSGIGGFDNSFGDMSPISPSDSPAVAVAKGVNKCVSEQAKKSKASGGKRKSKAIDVFNEFPTPASDAVDDLNIPRDKGVNSAKKLRSTPRSSESGNRKKSKATPVSVPKSVMVNVTNSTTTSSRSGSAPSASKKKAAKAKATKSVDKDDSFDFSDSPVKSKSTGRLQKKTSSSALPVKAAPAHKIKAPTKPKLKSPSTTSEASSGALPASRTGRRGPRASRA